MTYLTETDTARAAEIAGGMETEIQRIAGEVAACCGITLAEITGQSRDRKIAHARQLAYFVANQSGASLNAIGRVFRRDHTSVLHGIRQEAKRRAMKPESAIPATSPTGAHPANEKGDPQGRRESLHPQSATNTGRRSLAPMAAGHSEGEQC